MFVLDSLSLTAFSLFSYEITFLASIGFAFFIQGAIELR
jgi:hypothetical protein